MKDLPEKEDLAIRELVRDALEHSPGGDSRHPSEEALTTFVEGTMAESERSSVERHLADCAPCSETLLLAMRSVAPEPSRVAPAKIWRIAASWLLVAGSLFAALSLGRVTGDQVESLALARMDRMLGGRVSAGAVRLAFDDGPLLEIADLRVQLVEGHPPSVQARSAVLRPVLSSLKDGQFQASLVMEGVSITIREVMPGHYTIDPVLPGARPPAAIRDAAWKHGLSAVSLENATIRYLGSADGMSFVLHQVQAEIDALKGPGPARIFATGSSAQGRSPFRVSGEIDFPEDGPPSYALGEVELGGVPLALLGLAGQVVEGSMSFSGELSSSGRTFSSLLHSLEGRGRVAVGHGSLPGVSLVKSLISSVDVASAKKPGLPAPDRRTTKFRSLTADLQLKAGELRSSGLRIEGANFELRGAGKVSANRKLDGAGRMIFNPGASRFLAQSIPEVRVWLKAPGELEVPFLASGVLPELELEARAPVRAEPGAAPPAFVPAEKGLDRAVREAVRAFGPERLPPPILAKLSSHLAAGGPQVSEAVQTALGTSARQEVLLTGYYEPTLEGRRQPSDRFRYPIYRVPGDPLLRGKTRHEIDTGALDGQGLELFWSDDPIGVFFLHIQGSGRLRLQDGTEVRLGFAGHNDHDYRSIGQVLVKRGDLTLAEATAPGIRGWLAEHPEQADEILWTNPRYIYFRETGLSATTGPIGSLGVPLVAWHSVAVDPAIYPPGSVGRLRGELPDGRILDTVVIAMDSGAAIVGPGRMDLFVGSGAQAGELAGRMRGQATIEWLGP